MLSALQRVRSSKHRGDVLGPPLKQLANIGSHTSQQADTVGLDNVEYWVFCKILEISRYQVSLISNYTIKEAKVNFL